MASKKNKKSGKKSKAEKSAKAKTTKRGNARKDTAKKPVAAKASAIASKKVVVKLSKLKKTKEIKPKAALPSKSAKSVKTKIVEKPVAKVKKSQKKIDKKVSSAVVAPAIDPKSAGKVKKGPKAKDAISVDVVAEGKLPIEDGDSRSGRGRKKKIVETSIDFPDGKKGFLGKNGYRFVDSKNRPLKGLIQMPLMAPSKPRKNHSALDQPVGSSGTPLYFQPVDKKAMRAANKKIKEAERTPIVVPAPVPTQHRPSKNQAGLKTAELEHYRDLLLAKRRELVGDMHSLESEAFPRDGNSNLSNLPIHMADMGTDNYEQEFTLGLMEKDRSLLNEINTALAKIQNGTFGLCEGTRLPIGSARLEAQPWANYSIDHARKLEQRMGR